MKTVKVPGVIFVYGNPLQKVIEMAKEFNLTVIGTSEPTMLIHEMSNTNDALAFFFFVTNDEELKYLNDMFNMLKSSSNSKIQFFVLSTKEYDKKINTRSNDVYYMNYEAPLTEKVIEEYIFDTVIHNQIQYVYRQDKDEVTKLTKSNMRATTERINENFNQSTMLDAIREGFTKVSENQQSVSVIDILKRTDKGETLKIDTQVYLQEKIDGLKIALSKAHNNKDQKEVVTVMMELYGMMTEDLKENSVKLIDGLIEESMKKLEEYKSETDNSMTDLEEALMNKDKIQIDTLLLKRDNIIKNVRDQEKVALNNANMLKEGLNNSLRTINTDVKELVKGQYGGHVTAESRLAITNVFNTSSKAISLKTGDLANGVKNVVEGLQVVIQNYSKLVDFDTTIIESQQRYTNVLETQRLVEKVEYRDNLSAKVRLLVSPTPNIGASTIMSMFSFNYKRILMLDFREVTSNTMYFTEMKLKDFLVRPISELEEIGNLKVQDSLSTGVDGSELKVRLEKVCDIYDAIFIIVDRYFTTGIDFDNIQRIQYLSSPSDTVLSTINENRQFYEPVLENLKQVGFILNLATNKVNQDLDNKLLIAGIDSSEVRINVVNMRQEIFGGTDDPSVFKMMSSNFRY